MYLALSKRNSNTQDLTKGERLRNVFIVFGIVAVVVVVSHILIKCRNRIPHIKNWPAIRRQSIRHATPSTSYTFHQRSETTAFTRAELDTVAPRYVFHDGILYDAGVHEKSSHKSTSPISPTPSSWLTQTSSASTIASLPTRIREDHPTKSAVVAHRPASNPSPLPQQPTPPPPQEALQRVQAPLSAYNPASRTVNTASKLHQRPILPSSMHRKLPTSPDPTTICAVCLDPLVPFADLSCSSKPPASLITDPSSTIMPSSPPQPHPQSPLSPPQSPNPTIRIITHCSHAYHSSCLQTWASRRRSKTRPRPRRARYHYDQGRVVIRGSELSGGERSGDGERGAGDRQGLGGFESAGEGEGENEEPRCPLCMWTLRSGLS